MNATVVSERSEAVQPALDGRAIAIAFMFASMGIMVITLVMTLFFQSEWSYVICAGIYAAKVAAERKYGITSPMSISILMVYLGMLAAALAGVDYTGYAGIIIFTWLFVVVGVLLAIGRPFTTFYSHGLGLPNVHRTVSVLWLTAYGSALVSSIALMPHPMFVVLPALMCMAGGISTVFVSFVWCGKGNERKRSFRRDGFDFRQIVNSGSEFVEVCDFYAKNIANDPHQATEGKPWEEVSAAVQKSELALGKDSVIFVCREGDRIVGSIRCVLDKAGRKFPTEADIDSSFDPLRRFGKLMLVGRLAIDEEYRSRPDVMSGLFGAFVDLALEKDISYVISAGFRQGLPTYLKLGFQMMFDKKDRRHGVRMSHGFVTYPVLLTFEHMVLSKARAEDMKFGLYDVANKYIAERWFKRTIVRLFIRRMRGLTPPVDIDEIRLALAEPVQPATSVDVAVPTFDARP